MLRPDGLTIANDTSRERMRTLTRAPSGVSTPGTTSMPPEKRRCVRK